MQEDNDRKALNSGVAGYKNLRQWRQGTMGRKQKQTGFEDISKPVCWMLVWAPVLWGGVQRQWTGGTVRGGRGNVRALRLGLRELGLGGLLGVEALCASACQFAGHQRWFPLGQVLGGGDVVPCDLRLLWCSCWQLLVLYLRLSHVVVTRIKVFLL